jgi:phosphate transport system substrate-binding protein
MRVIRRLLGLLLGLHAAWLICLCAPIAQAADVSGAGSTFASPLIAKWAEAYRAAHNVTVHYSSVGSGEGLKRIRAKSVDFGASDKPLEPAELDQAGLIQFPVMIGGVVPVVNIAGIGAGQLRLNGSLLAGIYLGQVTTWNDPAIAQLNPGLALPDQAIGVVHRSDGSGTTFIFADYLAKVSPEWAKRIEANVDVDWPIGIGAKGNEGVAAFVGHVRGSIGYVEYAFAKKNNLAFALMANRDGEFVSPERAAFSAAAASADWSKAPGYHLLLTDRPGRLSWPMTGATFILMQRSVDRSASTKAALEFFDWALNRGGAIAEGLDYVAMPETTVTLVERAWRGITAKDGSRIWTGAQM